MEAIDNGFIENEIAKSAYEYQKMIDSKKRIIVGVNKFQNEEKTVESLHDIELSEVEKQIKDLNTFKSSRDHLQVKQSLKKLGTAAKGEKNLMPKIIQCVKSKCTLGEISDELRLIFGEH